MSDFTMKFILYSALVSHFNHESPSLIENSATEIQAAKDSWQWFFVINLILRLVLFLIK